jgi:uncharacterized protein
MNIQINSLTNANIYIDDAATLTMSTSPFQTHSFQARGNLEQYTSQGRTAQLPVVYLMTGVFKDAGSPIFRQHQMVETTSVVSIYHCELFVAGVQIYLYDVFANIYVVGGVDQLSTFRSNLGG